MIVLANEGAALRASGLSVVQRPTQLVPRTFADPPMMDMGRRPPFGHDFCWACGQGMAADEGATQCGDPNPACPRFGTESSDTLIALTCRKRPIG